MPDETRTHIKDPSTASFAEPGGSTADFGKPGDPPPPAPPPSPRYQIGEELSRGGMGAVHRATDTVLGREVAVKVLLPRHAPTSASARRFADEARVTGQLQHPNIPPVHDIGTLPDGRPFLAMKLIRGDTLEVLLKSGASTKFVAAFEKVCEAVAFAHSNGVIHRDLKPANVMVGAFGEVQVMDWGLAKTLGERPGASEPNSDPDAADAFTQAGAALGTPAYIPPEQALGELDRVDTRSDVFGLGGILAAILTGRPPFVGADTKSTLEMAAAGDLLDCFARLDGCGADPELVALAKRCLAPDPANRPADAGVLAKEVAALRAVVEERAKRAELDRATQRLRVRLVGAVAAGLLALLGGIAGVVYQSLAAERAELQRRALKGEVDLAQARELAAAREAELLRESNLQNEGVAQFTVAALRIAKGQGSPDAVRRGETEIRGAVASLERARREFSANPNSSFFLGLGYTSLAERKLNTNTPAEAEAALVLLDKAEEEFARVMRDTSGTGLAELVRAAKGNPFDGYQYAIDLARLVAYQRLGRYSQALEALDHAFPKARALTTEVPLSQDVVEPNFAPALAKLNEINQRPTALLNAGDEDYRFYREVHLRGAEMEQARLPWSRGPKADHAKAMRLAAYLADTRGVAGPAVYNAACVFAVASAATGIDATERERRAGVAVGYLDRLCKGGYFAHPTKGKGYQSEIATDSDLDPLRSREDFRRVLADSQRSVEVAPPPRAAKR